MNSLYQYYYVLGLRWNASPGQIKQAYRRLAQLWHPDRFPDDPWRQQEANRKMQDINMAYQMLKDIKVTHAEPDPAPAPVPDIDMVFIKGGVFDMGDTFGDGKENEKPIHKVTIDDFSLSKYVITQGQWKVVMGSNPSHVAKGDYYPVENISWLNAQEFIRKLNERSGKSYRLPTEAEWEYAARSGGKRERYAGTDNKLLLDEYGWCNMSMSAGSTRPVGRKKPNTLGLFDMSGNVWEWCHDWYDENYYKISEQINPRGPGQGDQRVLRGGCWFDDPRYVRVTFRVWSDPNWRSDFFGFRIAL